MNDIISALRMYITLSSHRPAYNRQRWALLRSSTPASPVSGPGGTVNDPESGFIPLGAHEACECFRRLLGRSIDAHISGTIVAPLGGCGLRLLLGGKPSERGCLGVLVGGSEDVVGVRDVKVEEDKNKEAEVDARENCNEKRRSTRDRH